VIISSVIGGLGNQMFQYAVGRALAFERGGALRLDVRDFAGYDLHYGFELLRVFNCHAEIANREDLTSVLGWQSLPVVKRILLRPTMSWLRTHKFALEPHFHYWQGIAEVPLNCYLQGYWQSEKYFAKIASTIRSDFTFKSEMSEKNLELSKKIEHLNSISLHVRRGDYVSDAKTNTVYASCMPEYYQNAVQYISRHVTEPYFFVFSDDMAWAKEHLKLQYPCEYVDINSGLESYNDMRLMSLCKHHIIANSSFSWWGAWLNQNPGKIVVAPRKWFSIDIDTKDLLPQEWVTL
jgi:hypothetical protein